MINSKIEQNKILETEDNLQNTDNAEGEKAVSLNRLLASVPIISFSGGKDSTALILWAKENLKDFITVFCDTHWEHDITYTYINYINSTLLNNKLIVVSSDKYGSFEEMCLKKKRVPSTMARFCTEELKLKPMKKFIQQYLPNIEIYIGVRADESFSRSKLPELALLTIMVVIWLDL